MSYPYNTDTTDAIDRLGTFYNGSDYDAISNTGGMANGGHRVNFIPSLQDLAIVAESVSDAADSADADATSAAASAVSAAASAAKLQGTSTTSITPSTGAKSFTTQASKFFEEGTYVTIVSDADEVGTQMGGIVTSYVGTALTVLVTTALGTGAHTDWKIYASAAPGTTGPTGAQGATGDTPTMQWTFSSGTADTDPGNGTLMLNNSSPASASFIYIDNADRFGNTATSFLDFLDDSTNTADRGLIFLFQLGAVGTTFALYKVTGAVIDGTGYRKIPVTFVQAVGTFGNGASIAFMFTPAGDKGIDGTGSGDVASDVAVSVGGEIAIYAGLTGKHITTAGFGISTSGTNIGALSTNNTWAGIQSFSSKTDLQGSVLLSGDISPPTITADQNDYAPTGYSTCTAMRISSDTGSISPDAPRKITGIQGGEDGRLLVVQNVHASNLFILSDEHTSSTAANRFTIGHDLTLQPSQSAMFRYDATSTRWRIMHDHTISAYNLQAAAAAGVAMINGSLTESHSASPDSGTVTFAVKTLAGSDPSAADPVLCFFPSSGSIVMRKITAALSLNIPFGSSLGVVNAVPFRIHAILIDDGGTVRLGVFNSVTTDGIVSLTETMPISATAILPSPSDADSAGVFYTSATVTSKFARLIGHFDYDTGLVAGGNWIKTPDRIIVWVPGMRRPGDVVQARSGTPSVAATNSASAAFVDSTTLKCSITPTSPQNVISLEMHTNLFSDTGAKFAWCALRRSGVVVGGPAANYGAGSVLTNITIAAMDSPGTTSQVTYTAAVAGDPAAGNTASMALANTTNGSTEPSNVYATEIEV